MIKGMDLFSERRSDAPKGTLLYREFTTEELVTIDAGTTSRGNQKKYKTRDGAFYVKELFSFEQRQWKDNLVEVLASQYAAMCSLPVGIRVVRQGLCTVEGRPGSYSEAFDKHGDFYLPFSRAALADTKRLTEASRNCKRLGEWFSVLRDYFSMHAGSDQTTYLVTMMLLDLIVANEDRHLSNFGYICREGCGRAVPSILFDFGLGLFEHSPAYYPGIPLDRAIKKVRLQPWGARVPQVVDFLMGEHSGLVQKVLPSTANLRLFDFPSPLAREYFSYINERLGVEVVGL